MPEPSEDRSKADAEILRRTPWTLISAAQKGETGAFDRAVERIYAMFEGAVKGFLRTRGFGSEEARDLSQEFFATLLERKFLERLDPAKGRLRPFLFSSLQRFLCDAVDKRDALKRRPGAGVLSLDRLADDFSAPPEDPRAHAPGRQFSRAWAAEMLGRALEGMKRRCEGTPQEGWYRAVVLWHEVGPGASALNYADLAQRLGVNAQQAANYLFRGRSLLRSLLLEQLAATCSSDAEVEEEIRDLFKALADGGSP
jgi:DNA-directed RNA polymerase specialized sigma24 family protein